jgi:hypothetical protein
MLFLNIFFGAIIMLMLGMLKLASRGPTHTAGRRSRINSIVIGVDGDGLADKVGVDTSDELLASAGQEARGDDTSGILEWDSRYQTQTTTRVIGL